MDVDHVIPLKWAHLHGGWRWTKNEKETYANDFENLILVDDGRNPSKSAKGPGSGMPNSSAYHCHYISRWHYLIDKYNLSPNQTDKNKISEMLELCDLSLN